MWIEWRLKTLLGKSNGNGELSTVIHNSQGEGVQCLE